MGSFGFVIILGLVKCTYGQLKKKSVLHNYLFSQHLKKPIETTKWHVDFAQGACGF
jgi:hypothetical protein